MFSMVFMSYDRPGMKIGLKAVFSYFNLFFLELQENCQTGRHFYYECFIWSLQSNLQCYKSYFPDFNNFVQMKSKILHDCRNTYIQDMYIVNLVITTMLILNKNTKCFNSYHIQLK